MDPGQIVDALVLGIVEGLTEFIPVSSTAHLLLLSRFLGFQSPGNSFEILIQFGAILAVVAVYLRRIFQVVVALPTDPRARRFTLGLILACIPAAAAGAILHDFITRVLYASPVLISVALILGGFALLAIDRAELRPRYDDAMNLPIPTAVIIGVFQMLALIPGVSRSGATIAGGLLVGCDRRAAAEYSFFLAMPIMVGAFAFEFYENRALLHGSDLALIAIGFVAAFVSALVVVRMLLDFVSRRGFAPFAWWRLVVGAAGLAAVLVYG
ncbi:MAG TPA: undecaprenyl-diphosphate phosphatase [Hyphomicrobiales bacterium]|nr:undecaprenyl-diphosphate phosphatase [Hyphomicrobiales bacterium]